MAKKIIVIGSGAAGMTAASAARETDSEAEITVFTEEEHISYSPCAIPFVLEGRIKDFSSIIMHDPEFYRRDRNISVRTRTKVVAADADKHTVTLADGETLPYDSLVLATGGTVFVPPIAGIDLPGVFRVRFIKDGMDIQAALPSVRSVVVAGAGVIGLEVAVALRHAGKEVTVVEMFPQIIPRICDQDVAKEVQSYCEGLGIKFRMGTPLGSVCGENKVEKVVVGKEEIFCDMVIMATGVRANLELPNLLGLEIGALGAVRTSPTLQPYKKGRLVKDIYLAGDVVMCQSAAVPGPTMSQLGATAVRQGRVAGMNAAGGRALFPEVLSAWISQIGDLQVGGTGLSRGLADYYGLDVVEALHAIDETTRIIVLTGYGAIATAVMFTIGKFLIGLYVAHAAVASPFGAAGSLVILLIWVYYSAQIFLLGAEFTWAWAQRRAARSGTQIEGAG